MKKLFLFSLLTVFFIPINAQNWVTIPDDNFANKLNELFPECMDGNQMNTECEGIVNATNLFVQAEGITDLTGLEYFVNLEVLKCNNNPIAELPELPTSLTELVCFLNNLNSLPQLPSTLTILTCYYNNLTELPELPASVTELNCNNNNLTSLPQLPSTLSILKCTGNDLTELPELPQTLTILNCAANDISVLPELPEFLTELNCNANNINNLNWLPPSLEELRCTSCNLSVLPELPETLQILRCDYNNLSGLPLLPQSLTFLRCSNNNLTVLPELPQSLTKLLCENNELTDLPQLPQMLDELICNNNYLTELPELPQMLNKLRCNNNILTELPELPPLLTMLRCQNNQLTCLPTLPMTLIGGGGDGGGDLGPENFDISNNLFTCLPNYVPAMSGNNESWLSFPLCDLGDLENNPYGCSSLDGIAGVVFIDEDENCELGEEEGGLVNAPLKLLNDANELITTTYTFSNSFYNFMADSGAYSVQLVTENMPFQPSCVDPGSSQDVELTSDNPSALNVDFGVECSPGYDIGVQSVVNTGWVFPGQLHTLRIAAGDMSNWLGLQCADDVGGTLTVYVDGPVSYVGPAEGGLTPIVSGDLQFTYDIPDFSEVNFQQDFALLLETDTTAQADDLVCIEIVVDPIDGDLNPTNNSYNHCYTVVNSYDPNIKEVWPHNVEPGFEDYFNYTIYFQNTGTAPAFNIRVADTLDTNLDLNTFEVTAYSHPCLTYVSGNVAAFRFNNIMLPDSATDFDGSIGYVQYRIKPVADLPVGTVIENTAHIFFDFNDAIVTNTTENEFVITTSVADRTTQSVQVYPNPGTGLYNVSLHTKSVGVSTIEVYTLSGVRVLEQSLNSRRTTLDLTNQPPGMYLLRLQNEIGSEVVKVVKH